MTVLDSMRDLPGDGNRSSTASSGVLLDAAGVATVEDMGLGRGPSWLDDWLAVNAANVVAWFRHLHAHPELSRQEFATTQMITGLLRDAGLHPVVLAGSTGVLCDIGTGPRCVALRADVDALPITEATGLAYSSAVDGVCHACGHDAHTAILLAAGLALASAPELPGRVRLIFQHAEEVMPGGALDVIDQGGLDGVQRIFGLHCDPRLEVGRVGTRVGAITSAADLLELRLTSPGGHTSRPHLTADLVHALGSVITGLPTLLSRKVDPRSGTVLVWGAVHAGDAANAVPQDGLLLGTLRTAEHDVWLELKPLVASLVEALLAPTGVGFELRHRRGVPPLVTDRDSTAMLRTGVAAALGDGAQRDTKQSSGGEDFGWYLEHVPGSFARLGVSSTGEHAYDLHQATFRVDERALFAGARVMVHTALSALAS